MDQPTASAARRLSAGIWLAIAIAYWLWRAVWNAGWQLFSVDGFDDHAIAAAETVGGYVVLVVSLTGVALLFGSRRWLIAAGVAAVVGAWRVVRLLTARVPEVAESPIDATAPPWFDAPLGASVFWASLVGLVVVWRYGRRPWKPPA